MFAVLFAACTEQAPAPSAEAARTDSTGCDAPGVRQVVEELGGQLNRVSLLAPDSIAAPAVRDAYAPFVTAELLASWMAHPDRAPGRTVSSPWPERIEIRSVMPVEDARCRVEGEVVYVTSVEAAQGGAAAREPVTLWVKDEGGWRVSAYEKAAALPDTAPPDSASADARAAADVVRRYYAAIANGNYREAYDLWGDRGAASGQTFEAFASGFAHTARVEAGIGAPGRIEPAAGSRYVEVPVTVRAVTDDGEVQQFEGAYTLRRTVVPGSTEAQRRWHLYTADVQQLR